MWLQLTALVLVYILSHVCAFESPYGFYAWGRVVWDNGSHFTRWMTKLESTYIEMCAIGAEHMVTVEGGVVYTHGNNQYGQRGDGSTTARSTSTTVYVPQSVVAVAAGAYFSLALASDRKTLYAWGDNRFGQLGDGTFVSKERPVVVQWTDNPNLTIRDISAGVNHVLIRARDNSLWICGANDYGQLGDGTTNHRATFAKLEFPSSLGIPQKIATGHYHNIVGTDTGKILVWGSNVYGELGIGSDSHNLTSVQSISLGSSTSLINGKKARLIAAGRHFTIAITADNTFFAWGLNSNGQLTKEPSAVAFRNIPTSFHYPKSMPQEKPIKIAAGADFVLLLYSTMIFGWGNNDVGQLASLSTDFKWLSEIARAVKGDYYDAEMLWISAGHSSAVVGVSYEDYLWTALPLLLVSALIVVCVFVPVRFLVLRYRNR